MGLTERSFLERMELMGLTTKPMTNADRIRSMSDEELAELFASWIQDCGCNNVPCREPCKKKLDADIFAAAPCEKNWLDWLKQESMKENDRC